MTIIQGATKSNDRFQFLVSVPRIAAARYVGTTATKTISATQTPQCIHVSEVRVRGYSIVPGSISLPEAVAPRNTAERNPLVNNPVSTIRLTRCTTVAGSRVYSLRSKYHHPFRTSSPGWRVNRRAVAVDIIKRKMKRARLSRQHFQAYMNPPCERGAETVPANRAGKSPISQRPGCAIPPQTAPPPAP